MSKTPASSSATRTGESSPALAVQTSAYASADGVLGPLIVSGVSVPFAVAVHLKRHRRRIPFCSAALLTYEV